MFNPPSGPRNYISIQDASHTVFTKLIPHATATSGFPVPVGCDMDVDPMVGLQVVNAPIVTPTSVMPR
jgi:hypothetical protein